MSKEISIFTDGGMRQVLGKMCAGWGFYGETPDGKVYTGFGAAGENVSNNVAELSGAIKAIEFAIKESFDIIHMFLDSQYVILCMNDVDCLEENDYLKNGVPVKNETYRRHIGDLKQIIVDKNIKVNFEWVKGHSGVFGNEQADVLATRGVLAQSKGDIEDHYTYPDVEEDKEEETPDKIKVPKLITTGMNPLVTGRDWYFKTNISHQLDDGRYMYCSASFDRDSDDTYKNAGKVASDSHYSILITKNPIIPMDKIKESFDNVAGLAIAGTIVDVDFIRREAIWKELTHAFDSFIEMKGSLALTPNKEIAGTIVKPPRLIYRMQDYFGHGLDIINKFEEKDPSLLAITCTDMFVTKDKKGKSEIHKHFTQAEKTFIFKHIKLPNGKDIDVKLNVGIDMPTRNQMSNMLKNKIVVNTEMFLILWSIGEKSYHCGFLIKQDDDIAFYYTSESSYRIID